MNQSYELYKQYFQELWQLYPRKEGKESAYLEYLKVINTGAATQDDMIEKIKRYAYSMKGKETYVISMFKWLNGKRWQDELPELPTANITEANKAMGIIVKLGSGSATPEAVRWLKTYLAKNGRDGLRLTARDLKILGGM